MQLLRTLGRIKIRSLRLVVATGVVGVSLIAGAQGVGAGTGTCPNGTKGCALWDYQPYEFATSDGNLSNNYYDEPCGIFCNDEVNDHVKKIRARNYTVIVVCAWQNYSYTGGLVGYAYYSENWWHNTSWIDASSISLKTSGGC